jgi:hypothetical protein
LDRAELLWILSDTDHAAARLSEKAFCRRLDPKGFWRINKAQDPELRHTVLSLVAFDDLKRVISKAESRDAGIHAFCSQNDGDGWMLPETLCLADLGLTRTVDVGMYDERTRTPQPVRSRLGERFLPWQLEQTPEESWAECERHARAILGEDAFLKLMANVSRAPVVPSVDAMLAPSTEKRRPDLGPLFQNR